MTVIERIKELLRIKNITQDKLASMLNTTRMTVNNYLTSRTKIDVDTLEKIAKILGVSVSYFFEENNGPGIQQVSKINVAGSGNVNTGSINISDANHEIELLRSKLEACRQEVELKNQIIDLLKEQRKRE